MKKLCNIQVNWWKDSAWYWHKGDTYFMFSIGRLQFMVDRG